MRQSRPRPSSRVSRTWQEVPTLSSQVYLNSTFLTDKGCAPARPALHVWKPSQPPLSLIPALLCVLFMFFGRATPDARERIQERIYHAGPLATSSPTAAT